MSHGQDLAKMILAWFPIWMECKWGDGSVEIAVFVRTRIAVAKSWYLACKGLTERKRESIVAGTRAEDVHVARILFDSRQLDFRTCLREVTKLFFLIIRKLRSLSIVLPLLLENTLYVLTEWVIQVHARNAADTLRVHINIPLGLYILERSRTVGYKMRRLQRAPVSLQYCLMHLFHRGVQVESMDYCNIYVGPVPRFYN